MAVWLITGASRGLGEAIALAALEAGHQVIAGARKPQDVVDRFGAQPNLLPVALDVTNAAEVDAAVQAGVDNFGRIDVVVNNAGHGVLGTVEEVSDEESLGMFEVNVFGVHRVIRSVLPLLRSQGDGCIINISSGGGFASSAAHGLYGATKFALEGLTEALDLEVKPLGIRTILIEPGAFRTGFFSATSIKSAAKEIEDYHRSLGGNRRETFLAVDGNQPGDPRKAAAAILDLAAMPEPPFRVQFGRDSLSRVEGKLDSVRRELEEWRWLAESTDHDDAAAAFTDPGRPA